MASHVLVWWSVFTRVLAPVLRRVWWVGQRDGRRGRWFSRCARGCGGQIRKRSRGINEPSGLCGGTRLRGLRGFGWVRWIDRFSKCGGVDRFSECDGVDRFSGLERRVGERGRRGASSRQHSFCWSRHSRYRLRWHRTWVPLGVDVLCFARATPKLHDADVWRLPRYAVRSFRKFGVKGRRRRGHGQFRGPLELRHVPDR